MSKVLGPIQTEMTMLRLEKNVHIWMFIFFKFSLKDTIAWRLSLHSWWIELKWNELTLALKKKNHPAL